MNTSKRDLEFLFEIGSLRNVQRGWRQHLGVDCANDLEHTYRVIWLALIIARHEKAGDEGQIIKMALVHDLPETRVSDLSYVQKVYVQADEDRAARDMFSNTCIEDFFNSSFLDYERRDSIEAKIVKDADNLDIDLELKELDERGSKLPEKWREFRKIIRNEKLYTNSAKELWDLLQTVDIADWHMKANKWLIMPKAGL